MTLGLTLRQWRALATVYHLYAAKPRCDGRAIVAAVPTASDDEPLEEAKRMSKHNDNKSNNNYTRSNVNGRTYEENNDLEDDAAAQWVEGVLPLLQRAFPEEMLTKAEAGVRPRVVTTGGRERQRAERWRQLIPATLDAFLSRILLSSSSVRDGEGMSLTTNEAMLLRLLNKEQRLADRYYQKHAALQGRVRREGEALLRLAEEATDDETPKGLKERPPGTSSVVRGSKHERSWQTSPAQAAKRRLTAVGLLDSEDAAGAVPPPRALDVSDDDDLRSPSASKAVGAAARVMPMPAATVDLICAGCGEQGGELFQCCHCHSLRHEACDGPKVDSETGFCGVCSHELGLSFSNGSLRSSTSTEERDELGEEDDDDDLSSLSGFIVKTSDESETSSTSSSASSSSSLEEEEKTLLPEKQQRQKQPRQKQKSHR